MQDITFPAKAADYTITCRAGKHLGTKLAKGAFTVSMLVSEENDPSTCVASVRKWVNGKSIGSGGYLGRFPTSQGDLIATFTCIA